MTLDEIYEMWEIDGKIDNTNITNEAVRIPELHNKYSKMMHFESLRLSKLKTEYKELFKLKTSYYKGELDIEELKEYGWEPQPLKILRQDLSIYLDADKDIINKSLRVGYQSEVVSYLESILKQIHNRGFQLSYVINWEKFKAGIG